LVLVPAQAIAQGGDDSPYSSFGFGDLVGTATASQAIMGGTGIAITDPYAVLQANPAAYAGMVRTNLELSGVGHLVQLSTDQETVQRNNARLLGLNVGVPFKNNRWGLALGLQPVSEVGYLIENPVTLSDGTSVLYRYQGNGGINRVFAGLGVAIWQRMDSLGNGPRLSVGGNFNYLFGTMEQTRKAYYPNGLGFYDTKLFSSLNVSDPTGTFGIQFQGDLVPRTRETDGWKYMIGLSTELATNLQAHRTDLYNTFVVINNVEVVRDTISYAEGVPGRIALPAAYGIGASVFNAHWALTAEVRMRDWSALSVDVTDYRLPTDLARSTTYAVGASWRPTGDRSGGSFWERSTYRMGFRYAQDYLVVNNTQLDRMGVSLGTSLPLLGSLSRSRLTLGAELGQRGSQSDGLIQERYVDVFVGITFTPDLREPWFKKRRIE